MSRRINIFCIKFKIATFLFIQLHVRVNIWCECLKHLHDRTFYWNISPMPAGVIFHVCHSSNYCFWWPPLVFSSRYIIKKFEDTRELIGNRDATDTHPIVNRTHEQPLESAVKPIVPDIPVSSAPQLENSLGGQQSWHTDLSQFWLSD